MQIYQKHIFKHLRDVEAYKQVTDINEKGIARLMTDVVEEFGLVVYSDEVKKPEVVATLYSTPKIHKEIYGERYIFGGSNLPLAPMSKILSVSMRLCFTVLDGIMGQMWLAGANGPYVGSTIVTTSDEVARKVQQINSHVAAGRFTLKGANVASLDFSSLYPSIPLTDLIDKTTMMIYGLFEHKRFHVNQHRSKSDPYCHQMFMISTKWPNPEVRWVSAKPDTVQAGTVVLDAKMLVSFVKVIVTQSFCAFGGKLWQSVRGFPTGSQV